MSQQGAGHGCDDGQSLGLQHQLGAQLTWSGGVTLTLKSWGGGTVSGTGDCTNEMLFMHVGNTAYAFSFKQNQSALIR